MSGDRAPDQVVRGEVAASNPKGIKLVGAEGWLNVSQYSGIDPATLPQRGEAVEVLVRGGKWLQAVKVLTPGEPDAAESDAAWPEVAPSAPPVALVGSGDAADADDPGTWGYTPGRDRGNAAPRWVGRAAPPPPPLPAPKPANRAALKAAALAAAAHFHSGKPEATEDDVFETAYRFIAFLEDADGGGA